MNEQLKAEQIKQLPRRADGLFELKSVDENLFRAAGQVFPVYAAYETDCNGKEGYPDLLAQMRTLRGELEKDGTLENRALFLDGLLGTVENVSPQLYEYYRELADMFKEVLRETMTQWGCEAAERLKKVVAHAAELH
ncbi:MAG: hypothetical protein K2J60_09375, partial [Acetatifactor sp.]|nr:hypothetical protein [Acetatifactor sp.]